MIIPVDTVWRLREGTGLGDIVLGKENIMKRLTLYQESEKLLMAENIRGGQVFSLGILGEGNMGIGVVESSRHLCGHASTISDAIRPKDSTKIKDLTLILD